MNGNEHLVHLLLASGSSVNSRACGPGSLTALQAICSWDTATEEEYERKVRICQLLISHGADINAAPARIGGFTALQRAAMAGHLETAVLLLRNGARVNAPPCGNMGNIALDAAVLFRRLDMTKFLLNANALSHFRGKTGYDGAIELAERMGNFPLAYLIREHAGNNMALDLMNPELLKPQEDYRIYGYVTDEEYDIDRYNPEALWEHCTMDSLCRYYSGIAPDQQ
ncbi:ankyrin repeat-containing domain protein [Diaporthe sp. PMI_573]|nr:ankyrin repeat-containing domain protein [Diaporthaceae sp. PMI_573]